MKFEFSAGGIVLRQAQAIGSKAQARRDFDSKPQSSKKKIEILLCQHSQHHGWIFPKGLIGDKIKGEKKSASAKGFGETKEEAALREVGEETGVKAKIIKPLTPAEYWYVFEGEKVKKKVYYFLMEYVSGDIKSHDFEMENVEWLPIGEVEKRLSYKSDKQVWEIAKKEVLSFKN